MVRYLNNDNPLNNSNNNIDDDDDGEGAGDALLAGGVSAGSPQIFTGHNRFSENLQTNALTSSLDVVVGRYLYTGNDILKEVESEGIISEIEYTAFKGCAKLNGGSLGQPQNFTGNNSFSAPITVSNTRFQIKNNTATILDVNGSNNTSNVTITPSGISGSGIEVRAVGDPQDPNANKIILNENTFMPPSVDLHLGDFGSLRTTLTTLFALYQQASVYTYDKVCDIRTDPGALLFHSREAVWSNADLGDSNVVLPDGYYQCFVSTVSQLDVNGNIRGASFYSQVWVLKLMFSYIQDTSNLTNDVAPIITEQVTQFSHQNGHGSAEDEGRVQIYYKPTQNDGDDDLNDGQGVSMETYMRWSTVSRNDDYIKLRFSMRKLL